MNYIPFITVEGPIGVGKTSLAKLLSEHLNYALLKEIVEENPFLGKFYDNIEEWSFQTEMFFLCNRYKQLNDIKKNYLTQNQPVIADYHILKNMIFANQSLQKEELQKYEQIYGILTEDLPKPNVIIYLHASLETIMKRIRLRDREIEKNISPIYLEQLSRDYDKVIDTFSKQNPAIPILTFNGDELDFVESRQDLQTIIDVLSQTLRLGV